MSFQQEEHVPWYFVDHEDFSDRFFYYGTGGLYDPKNYTIEPWLLGGGRVGLSRSAWRAPTLSGFARGFLLSQSVAFIGLGLVGAILDPLDRGEGGLDEHIGSVYDWVDAGNQATNWWASLPWPYFLMD